ncbi:hypothetical protein MIND_00423000 [Mycena indigotica]|uniref:AAA-ATPase-like domain-containing protein n=1 Tax=Mycena indigotica TaxID=2126181 RepID=A0A8H6W972_9AGAR|nr:uncharacterized protein MIND_00423000 [Mycena indigotica]KAF7306318.1 hypothetical protein MIND_00423000 [Mycena indigotica]
MEVHKDGKNPEPSTIQTLPLPHYRHQFLHFFQSKSPPAFVDKRPFVAQLPDEFRYILARPPRFGKTTFISTLQALYDTSTVDEFAQLFNGVNVTTKHNQHLCLAFTFVGLGGTLSRISDRVRSGLKFFVRKYAKELDPLPPNGFSSVAAQMLTQVITLVSQRKHSLFVSVDDFDGPFRLPTRSSTENTPTSFKDVADTMKENLWTPLFSADPTIIPKLIVSCALLPDPALLRDLGLSAPAQFNLVCGFTEQDVSKLALEVLGTNINCDQVKEHSGEYFFSSVPVLHPQRTLTWIKSQLEVWGTTDDKSVELLKTIIYHVPDRDESQGSSPSNLWVDRLIDLIATCEAYVDLEMGAFVDNDLSRHSLNSLYHLGLLVRSDNRSGTFRLSNNPVLLSILHDRIDKTVADRYQLKQRCFYNAWVKFSILHPADMVEILESVFRDRVRNCLKMGQEPNLLGILELTFRNGCITGNVEHEHRRLPFIPLSGFDESVVLDIPKFPDVKGKLTLELITLTLTGLWYGKYPGRHPTREELEDLHVQILNENDASLLDRAYQKWSSALKATEVVTVKELMSPCADPEHIKLVAVGGARILCRCPPATVQLDPEYPASLPDPVMERFYEIVERYREYPRPGPDQEDM